MKSLVTAARYILLKRWSFFTGNAGTAMRPLAAALCLGSNDIVLTGEPRMKERPIGHLVDALRRGGAQIDYLEQENYPPLRLRGDSLAAM